MFFTRVFILIIFDVTVKVLNTFKHLSRRGRKVFGAGLAFERGKRLVGQIRLKTYIFILKFSLPSRSSLLSEARTNEIKYYIHPE